MIDEITLAKMADMLSIASDQTRLKILVCLLGDDFAEGEKNHKPIERNVSDIVALTGASQSLVSHQLKILKDAELVESRRDGRQIFYSLSDRHVYDLVEVVLEHVSEE
ncbi:MAG: helix-turn-helix transcriptional regulator [Erysipelotrichaceae bacterium]|nr:helix-turn-helix transcriptional regulator [Erysipelotrichaceae bacterium]